MTNTDDSLPPGGPTLRQAFDALVETLAERNIRYAIIGGLAVLQHTRARGTEDIDALLLVPQVQMPGFFEALQQRGFTVDVQQNIRELREGFTSVHFGDVAVDLLHPVLPAYHRVLERAIDAAMGGRTVRVSSAEGLILTKLVAMRAQDEADIRDLLSLYSSKLDLEFIRREMDGIVDSNHPTRAKFEEWVRQASAQQ